MCDCIIGTRISIVWPRMAGYLHLGSEQKLDLNSHVAYECKIVGKDWELWMRSSLNWIK